MVQQNQIQYLEDYGKASNTATRFQIIGDNRVMLPIFASGTMYDQSTAPHHVSSGSIASLIGTGGTRNMISNGESIFVYGKSNSDLSKKAVRLGVSAASGGNVLATYNEYAFVFGNQRQDAGIHYTYMANGEAVFQDTNGATFGASIEQFQNNVAGTVTAAASGSTLTGAGTTFTTAALGGAGGIYNGIYTPSLSLVVSGDLIKITDGANVYWHRIKTITDPTHLEVFPNLVGSGTAGRAYSIWRSGYGSYSQVIPIYNSNTGGTAPQSFFNYYAGSHRSTSFPGTIQCFTREASGAAASSHFMCPQNGAGQDIKAQDVAYYKQFLLYGYLSTIGWSVAGFPTSFTTGFGATDFPATNISAVAINDQFISFEYVGEQLIALFKNSVWEVQATGSIPEFTFYKIPEPVGCSMQPATSVQTGFFRYRRPSVSARDSVYYNSHSGMLQLAGRTATPITKPVRAIYPSLVNSSQETPGLFWEPSSNSVVATGPVSLTFPIATGANDLGLMYNVDSDTWSAYDPANNQSISTGPIIRGSSAVPLVDSFCVFFYDGSLEAISQLTSQVGSPYAGLALTAWEWTTPVVSMGDQYGDFELVGFQLDGNYALSAPAWTVYGGKTPYSLIARQSGTMITQDNRQIVGLKLDDPFVQFKFSGSVFAMITKVNLYAEGSGK